MALTSKPPAEGSGFINIGDESTCQDVPDPSRLAGQFPNMPFIGIAAMLVAPRTFGILMPVLTAGTEEAGFGVLRAAAGKRTCLGAFSTAGGVASIGASPVSSRAISVAFALPSDVFIKEVLIILLLILLFRLRCYVFGNAGARMIFSIFLA